MSTLHITVTQEDIDNGIRNDDRNCPIALAAKRVRPGRWSITSNRAFPAGGWDYNVLLPEPARDFIHRFDNRAPVAPFEFELDVDDAVVTS